MRVAVDAMGGDQAPKRVVQGAVAAASQFSITVTLVGHEQKILGVLGGRALPSGVEIHHCEEVVEMYESPMKALRSKKNASIRVAFELLKAGQTDAVVSAGNSGATLAAGLLTLGRMKGVERPAIASIVPAKTGSVLLIDVGANVDCRPSHLLQFGAMAEAFATSCLNMNRPGIGLLSIGEEGTKGNEQTRLARKLFEQSALNFVGNVEGRDIVSGETPIIVCDGFVGNVALKLVEGMGDAMNDFLRTELQQSLPGRLALLLAPGPFRRLKNKLDYQSYGGAPLLGINGVSVICHGKSSPTAIMNAVKMADHYVANDVLRKMAAELDQVKDIKGAEGAAPPADAGALPIE